MTPEKELKEELKKEGKATENIEKIEKIEKKEKKEKTGATKSRGVDQTDEDALAVRLHTFDNNRTGIITIFDSILGKKKREKKKERHDTNIIL